jgi:Zn-dependent protease with chaperone function
VKTAGPDWLPPTFTSREQFHRRLTLLAIAGLLVLGISPVVGHHLPFDTNTLLADLDHIGTLCVTALHLLLAPIHRVFHILLVTGFLYALWDRVHAWRGVRGALGPLVARPPATGDLFREAAIAARLDPRRLRIVSGLPTPAFTVGWLSPRVYVAEALAKRLSAAELVAVLAHEGAHVRRRDPLRLSLLRVLACTLFWIPALRRLADDMADEAEVVADNVAAAAGPLVLASALLALAEWPAAARSSTGTVGFQQRDLLERRIRRLAGEETPPQSHVTRRSLAGALAALMLVWIPGILMAHPLPEASSMAHERHCDHPHESALGHLFCLGSPFAAKQGHCPHRPTS